MESAKICGQVGELPQPLAHALLRSEEKVRKFVVVFAAAFFLFTAASAFAQEAPNPAIPKASVSLSEGYTVQIKDGLTPGGVSTKINFGLGWTVAPKVSVLVVVGISTPNTTFAPNPRVGFGASYALTDRVAMSGSLLYQFNYGYASKPHSHMFGACLGPRLKVGNGFGLGFDLGVAKTIEDNPWTLLIQPSFSYTF